MGPIIALAARAAPQILAGVGSIIVPTIIDALQTHGPTPEAQAKIKGIIEQQAAALSAKSGLPMAQAMKQIQEEVGPQLDEAFSEKPGLMGTMLSWVAGGIAGGVAGGKIGSKIAGKWAPKIPPAPAPAPAAAGGRAGMEVPDVPASTPARGLTPGSTAEGGGFADVDAILGKRPPQETPVDLGFSGRTTAGRSYMDEPDMSGVDVDDLLGGMMKPGPTAAPAVHRPAVPAPAMPAPPAGSAGPTSPPATVPAGKAMRKLVRGLTPERLAELEAMTAGME